VGGASSAHGTPGATGLQSSPARSEEEEDDETKPMRGSPEHKRRWSGSVTVMKISGSSSSGMRGRGAGCSGGRSHLL
jgi:hypothetical protein